MSLENRLKEVGFTPNEIRIYLYILEKGSSTPPSISRALSMPRSNIHYILKNLIEKEVLKRQPRGKRFIYIPSDPSSTLELADRRRKILEEIMPDLQALYKKSPGKPVVKFYEGAQEVEKIFDEIVGMQGDLLCAFASLGKLFALMPDIPTRVQKAIKEKSIIFQEIVTPDSREVAEKARELMHPFHEYKILPEKYADFPTDILVWDESLALITFSEPVFGIILINKSLADTYRTHFEIIWNSL